MMKENNVEIVSINETCQIAKVSRATLWRWQKEGIFPSRRQLGPNRVGFIKAEVLDWVSNRPMVVKTVDPEEAS